MRKYLIGYMLVTVAGTFLGLQTVSAQPTMDQFPVVSLQPQPHPAGCKDFTSAGGGMWRVNGPIKIGNTIAMGAGTAFTQGVKFNGIDIARWLNSNCAHG